MLSYWERESYFKNIDVCIIGAGIVGLNAALHLKKTSPKLNILVIERSTLPYGASLRNAGFACFGSVSEILEDIKNTDEGTVLNLIEQRWNGLDLLKSILGSQNLELEINGGYELFSVSDSALYEECETELLNLNKLLSSIIGSNKIYEKADNDIHKFGFGNIQHLIKNNFEGQINTGKMMKALLNKVQTMGIDVLFGLPVLKLNESENHCTIHTHQFNFKSKKVLISTNGFAKQLINDFDIEPARAQVLVTHPIQNLQIKGTFHYDKGYYYFRNIDNRILLGGGRNLAFEEENTDKIELTPLIQNTLDSFLKNTIIPNQLFEIDLRWSGIMGIGKEKTPLIQFVSNNVAVAIRCNGMGVAIGSNSGIKGAELILSKLN